MQQLRWNWHLDSLRKYRLTSPLCPTPVDSIFLKKSWTHPCILSQNCLSLTLAGLKAILRICVHFLSSLSFLCHLCKILYFIFKSDKRMFWIQDWEIFSDSNIGLWSCAFIFLMVMGWLDREFQKSLIKFIWRSATIFFFLLFLFLLIFERFKTSRLYFEIFLLTRPESIQAFIEIDFTEYLSIFHMSIILGSIDVKSAASLKFSWMCSVVRSLVRFLDLFN